MQRFMSYLGRVPGLWRLGDVDVNLLVFSVKPGIMVSYSNSLGQFSKPCIRCLKLKNKRGKHYQTFLLLQMRMRKGNVCAFYICATYLCGTSFSLLTIIKIAQTRQCSWCYFWHFCQFHLCVQKESASYCKDFTYIVSQLGYVFVPSTIATSNFKVKALTTHLSTSEITLVLTISNIPENAEILNVETPLVNGVACTF